MADAFVEDVFAKRFSPNGQIVVGKYGSQRSEADLATLNPCECLFNGCLVSGFKLVEELHDTAASFAGRLIQLR
jgi:hypothetical protein